MIMYMFMIIAALKKRKSSIVLMSNPLLYAKVAKMGINPKDIADMTIRKKPKNFICYTPLAKKKV